MEFLTIDNLFYAAMFAAGGAGNLARKLSGSDRYSFRRWAGSTVAAGCTGGGGIAFWVAYHSSGDSGSSWLFLFASFALGYVFKELESVLIKGAIRKACAVFGLSEEKTN